jgi:hypothetical protein
MGTPIAEVIVCEGLALDETFMAGIAAGRSLEEQEFVVSRRDGTAPTVIASLVPARNAAGEVTGLDAHLLLRSNPTL